MSGLPWGGTSQIALFKKHAFRKVWKPSVDGEMALILSQHRYTRERQFEG